MLEDITRELIFTIKRKFLAHIISKEGNKERKKTGRICLTVLWEWMAKQINKDVQA